MVIETPRLILRPWTLRDLTNYERMSKDIGYNCFASPGIYLARDADDLFAKVQQRIKTFDEHGISKFPIFRKNDEAFVGTCGADFFELDGQRELEMGYRLLLDHWGQGYATEAAQAMLSYLLEKLRARSVFGLAVAQNPGSLKVLERIGFRYRAPYVYSGVEHKLYEASRSMMQQQD